MLVTSTTADGQVNLTDEAKAAGYQIQDDKSVKDKVGNAVTLNDKGEIVESGTSNTGQTQTNPDDSKPTSLTQKQIDDIITERLRRQKEQFDKERDEEARKQQEAKDLADGKLKEVAENRQRTIDELKPKADAASRYAEKIHESIDARISSWPDEIRDMDPGKETDPLVRLAWADKSQKFADRMKSLGNAPNMEAGNQGAGKKPVNDVTTAATSYMSSKYAIPGQEKS